MSNLVLWSAVLAWLAAQTIKMIISLVQRGRLDFSYMVSTGGMPSAHSASVSGLAAAAGLSTGLDSPLFAVATIFACIVMFDAQSVRLAAGKQAKLLNQMVDELFHEHHFSEQKMAELLGHTRLEVFAGAALGILTSFLLFRVTSM